MKFAVLADAHIGRSIPLAIAEHRRLAFSRAFSSAVNAMVEEGVDYVFFCGDLFERRTLRPYLVQFAHDELYRLAWEIEDKHDKKVKILVIRGNHDGRPQSNTLDYIRHPLADYLHVFNDSDIVFEDEKLYVVGLNYYDELDRAFNTLVKPALGNVNNIKIIMLHGFVQGYNDVPPYSSSVSLEELANVDPHFVFTGHYHKRCKPRRLPNGGWILTPGSLEMYDFAEEQEKGFYIVEYYEDKRDFNWISIEPMHFMQQAKVDPTTRKPSSWYETSIIGCVKSFVEELKREKKPGYLKIKVDGGLTEGFPSDISLDDVKDLIESEPFLLWVDVDITNLELPPFTVRAQRDKIDIAEFFSGLGEFAKDIKEMHIRVGENLEEHASVQTGLLTPSQRSSLINEWVERFENRKFRKVEI